MKVGVIIPVLNEEDSIALVIRDLPREEVSLLLVVDNGSDDQTAELARAEGAVVLDEAERGYGAACLRGIANLEPEIDTVVFLDGDYSDSPEELTSLVKPISEDRADMVIGSRILGQREPGALPPQAYWGNKFACFLMRILWGIRHTDLGPFRAIRRSSLDQLGMRDRNFGWTIEMQIKAHTNGLRVLEEPVSYRRRTGVSKISGTVSGAFKAGYKILYTIFRYRLSGS